MQALRAAVAASQSLAPPRPPSPLAQRGGSAAAAAGGGSAAGGRDAPLLGPGMAVLVLLAHAVALGQVPRQPMSGGATVRTAFRRPAQFSASISDGGALVVHPAGGGDAFTVESTFSQPGADSDGFHPPQLSSLTPNATGSGWGAAVAVDADADGQGWNVTASNSLFTLQRRVQLAGREGAAPTHLHVTDTIDVHAHLDNATAPPGSAMQRFGVAAIQIRHTARFTHHGVTATAAELPGGLYPFDCSTLSNQGEYTKDGMSYGSFGNAAVYMQSATAGVGLLPIDDVFLVHGAATQRAVARYPRAKNTCNVTTPPSIEIADLNLGLKRGRSYTQEWAVYPTSTGGDYYSFINAARQTRWGEATVRLNGTGYLSMNSNLPDVVYSELEDAGYSTPWGNWTEKTMETFLKHQSMHFVTTNIPYTKKNDPCRKSENLYCTGSCFVHELPPVYDAAMRQFARKVAAADRGAGVAPRPRLVYMDTWLTSESNATSKYRDSAMLSPAHSASGEAQLAYEHCGKDTVVYPLFFGTENNSYGQQLDAYVEKAFDMGFNGIYHDDFMLNDAGYTFDPAYWGDPFEPFNNWDGVSVVVEPRTLEAVRGAQSLVLLTQQHELAMLRRTRQRGGTMLYNGAPITRTWVDAVASGDAMYFAETGEQCRARFMHLSTPIALTRDSSQTSDLDPKYQETCHNTKDVAACLSANIIANLDYGVLSFLYDGLFKEGSGPNLLEHMFPIDVLHIEPHTVWGVDRIVTSSSGVYGFAQIDNRGYALPTLDGDSGMTVYTYRSGALRNTTKVAAGGDGAGITLQEGTDVAVIVRDCDNVSRNK
jgi:hypothetical protein